MPLFNKRTLVLDTSGVEAKLDRLNYLFEQYLIANNIPVDGVPSDMELVDPDEYSYVFYTDEEQELIQQHLAKRVAGVQV